MTPGLAHMTKRSLLNAAEEYRVDTSRVHTDLLGGTNRSVPNPSSATHGNSGKRQKQVRDWITRKNIGHEGGIVVARQQEERKRQLAKFSREGGGWHYKRQKCVSCRGGGDALDWAVRATTPLGTGDRARMLGWL